MSTETVLSTLLSAAIGVAATWFFAWLYYRRAGEDLRIRAERLQQTVNVLGRAMERQGWATLVFDGDGNVIGLEFGRGLSGAQPAGSETLGVRHARGPASSEPPAEELD